MVSKDAVDESDLFQNPSYITEKEMCFLLINFLTMGNQNCPIYLVRMTTEDVLCKQL